MSMSEHSIGLENFQHDIDQETCLKINVQTEKRQSRDSNM